MKTDTIDTIPFQTQKIAYGDTGFFTKIIRDYLSENEGLKSFYGRSPNADSFAAQIEEKAANYTHRDTLVATLEKQYSAAKLKSPALDLLKSDNTFTITTGHQVCLYTGPLYFFYKIITAINTCKTLKATYPGRDFIPVYWMATEDHDFEEANHFFLPSGKIEWESGQGGAVGRMNTVGMKQVAEELEEHLGIGYTSGELTRLFTEAYVEHATISEATRYLVHHIFGAYNVLVIEADDPELKKLAVPAFRHELEESPSAAAMKHTDKALAEEGYSLQVSPHEVNLFYLETQLRERIEKNESGDFEIAHTKTRFKRNELLSELSAHPERFSPNVILRPLYQEIILPNLAYIGGGGELAYWFQLKGVFEAFEVPFPILMLRNSVMVVDKDIREAMEKLGIDVKDVFSPGQELEDQLVLAETSESMELDDERERLEHLFDEMADRLGEINPDLRKSVGSGHARADRIVRNLEKKMMRAERKKQEILINRLSKVRQSLMPRNGLQERNMNFAPFYLSYGKAFVESLIENLDPFDYRFTVLTEV